MKKTFDTLKISGRDLCRVALLTALTGIFAMLFTFRIGNTLKIPFKFIPVFVTAILYGPFWAGFAAVFGDILNALLMPVGAFMPQITAVEFVGGFIYGLFLYKIFPSGKNIAPRVLCCLALQLLLDLFVTSALLSSAGYFPGYGVAVAARFPCGILKAVIQGLFIFPAKYYLQPIFKITGKN